MRTAIQDLITEFTNWSKLSGDGGFVGRSVLNVIQNGQYIEKENEQINKLLKMIVKLKEICENEISEFNIPELNQIITDYESTFIEDDKQMLIKSNCFFSLLYTKDMFSKLTDEQRMEVMSDYCKHCGSHDNTCQCFNDD